MKKWNNHLILWIGMIIDVKKQTGNVESTGLPVASNRSFSYMCFENTK